MDTSELLKKLQTRVEETTRDRDRLAEAVSALVDEIAKQTHEETLVAQLVERYEQAPSSNHGSGEPPEESQPDAVNVTWPAGPDYAKKIKVKKIKAWARYKLASADWYLNTLQVLGNGGELKRVLGVEMAVDGIVASLCAAFEASVFALTNAVERAAKIPDDRRTPVHLASWSNLAAEAKYLEIDLASSLSISASLIGEHSVAPQGWLAQLLVLRQRSARQDLLVDHRNNKTQTSELCIDVPGVGPRPLMGYLLETRDLIDEILETVMHDIAEAKDGRLHITRATILRQKAEREIHDLLASGEASQ